MEGKTDEHEMLRNLWCVEICSGPRDYFGVLSGLEFQQPHIGQGIAGLSGALSAQLGYRALFTAFGPLPPVAVGLTWPQQPLEFIPIWHLIVY
eukprot:2027068-Amphidinium_carterae.2